MRGICCVLLTFLFHKLAKTKVDMLIMYKTDKVWAVIWGALFYVSLIASIVLCFMGL